MIQLYTITNENFDMNGDYILDPIRCEFHSVLNNEWELELENGFDSNYNNIVENAVISCDTPIGKNQLFRIYFIRKTEFSVLAKAIPIFFDSKDDCFLFDVRPTSKNGQEALDIMMDGTKYSGISDVKELNTSYYIRKNLLEAITGQDENSFLNRWGGEVSFNNFTVTINKKIGNDNGVIADFGLNIKQISESVDMSDVCTRIIPVGYNGRCLNNNGCVDSENINKYPKVYQKSFEYQHIKLREDCKENEDDSIIICDTKEEFDKALINAAKEDFKTGIDKPLICYDIDMLDLSRVDEYKLYKNLLKINLGDYVHCFHTRLQIETIARVVEYTYDCITKTITNIVLGQYISSYFDNVSSIVNSAKNVINTKNDTLLAEKISGVIDMLNTSLKAQRNIAEKQDVRAILFEDIDKDSPNFGAMCLGTAGLQLSKVRNETNTDWIWGTAIDFRAIYAQYIITGILSDAAGNNYWNLDTGELVTKNMKAVNAYVSGDVYANNGTVGGWNMSGQGLYNGSVKIDKSGITNIYTWADLAVIQMIILGRLTLGGQETSHYDFDGDGQITAVDYMILKNRLLAL